jgi:di/tricarboxylate transporter
MVFVAYPSPTRDKSGRSGRHVSRVRIHPPNARPKSTAFMTGDIAFILLLTAVTFALMVWERISVEVVAMLAMCTVIAAGILTHEEAFTVFANEAPLTVACMFVLSAALERTGFISWIARRLDHYVGQSDLTLLLATLPIVAVLSAFVNNTPVVVVFMPVLISMAVRRQFSPSKLLMPLSFAAVLGGTCTLIGTSTNILVSGTASKLGQAPISMFELAKVGVILTIIGLAYMLTVGRRFLPQRETLASLLGSGDSKEYLTEVVIMPGSPLVGKRLAETQLKSLPDSRILDITRAGETLDTPLNEVVLAEGDHLRLTTVLSSVMEIKGLKGVEILPETDLGLEPVGVQKAVTVESVIGPDSSLIGKSIRQVNFRQRYGILILAVHRQGKNLKRDFARVRLRFGDTILMEGSETAIQRLRSDRSFLLLADVGQVVPRPEKMGIALATIGAVVGLATFTSIPISFLALAGVLTVVLTRCLDIEQVYAAIHWRIIFLIFGMLSLGLAMDKTGGAQLLAHLLIDSLGWLGPIAIVSAVYLLTSIFTEFLSNNAVAVLMTPIAIRAAESLDADPRGFVIAVALGASASFATPIGYQTNTLVYGAGGYQFRDFLKIGIPLNIICWIIATIMIPFFWPLSK